jgi:glycosyltransferase involved in cell wall biosynthesis
MRKIKKILVSNIEVPSGLIGSWVNRISFLIENDPDFFDYILSPSKILGEKSLHCSKKKWISYHPQLYKWQLKNWVAQDYLKAIEKTLKSSDDFLKVVVMDDFVLCEAIALLKEKYPDRIELIYSYHGHYLNLPENFGHSIDKIFFLTNLGYLESLSKNKIFSPEVFIVGNGVRSDKFFPLDKQDKLKARREMGFSEDDEIIVWMANSRPAKGIHLFKKIIPLLLAEDPNLKFLIIGNKTELNIESDKVLQLGRLSHDLLPKYLQISDYYFFTSLWKEGFGLSLVEAIKSGLFVLSSANGGIPEVIKDCDQVSLISEPNKTEKWVKKFLEIRSRKKLDFDQTHLAGFHSYEDWEHKFKKAIVE